jgi:hypothetical protein
MPKSKRSKMVRVPIALHDRLTRRAEYILRMKEQGRGYDDVPLAEQGQRVIVPLHAVIARGLDEDEGHRRRSNHRPRRKDTKEPQHK